MPTVQQLLDEQTDDLRMLDLAGFRRWIARHLERWEQDPVFMQRVRIRELLRSSPSLRERFEEHRRLLLAVAGTPQFLRLKQIEQELIDAGKAIEGLTAAFARKPSAKHGDLRQKLRDFRNLQKALRNEQAELIQSSPEQQALRRTARQLQRQRGASGLEDEEAKLQKLLKERGRRTGRLGSGFEDVAAALVQAELVPELSRGKLATRVQMLRGVTLGAARIEFDQLIIRKPLRPQTPVEVLAIVEVKRNINDLAHAFRLRQENLAWLTGDAAHYSPEEYRTQQFQSGHFDREAYHEEGQERFLFTRSSFRHFRRDPHSDCFLNRLAFVAREGPLWGIGSTALARISHRIATDEEYNLDDDAYSRRLFRWCRSLTQPVEAPDVLRIYLAAPKQAKRILIVPRSADSRRDD